MPTPVPLSMVKRAIVELFDAGDERAVEVRGNPGIGKTAMIREVRDAVERRMGQPVLLVTMHTEVMEVPQLAGDKMPVVHPDTDEQRLIHFMPDWVPDEDVRSKFPYCIVFIDEIDKAPLDMQKALSQLLDEKRINTLDLRSMFEHVMIVCASNPSSAKGASTKRLPFSTNRKCLIDARPDLNTWAEWATRSGVHPHAIGFARHRPELLFNDEPRTDGEPWMTPRSFVYGLEQICNFHDVVEDAPIPNDQYTRMFAQGWWGEGTAGEFCAFLGMKGLLTFEEIVKDPTGVKVPTEPSTLYALTAVCSSRVDQKNAGRVFRFLMRLPREFQVVGVTAAIQKEDTMMAQKEFSEYVRSNRPLIMGIMGTDFSDLR